MLIGTSSSALVAKIMQHLFFHFLVQSCLVLSQRVADTLGRSPALLKHSDFLSTLAPSSEAHSQRLEAQSVDRHGNTPLQRENPGGAGRESFHSLHLSALHYG